MLVAPPVALDRSPMQNKVVPPALRDSTRQQHHEYREQSRLLTALPCFTWGEAELCGDELIGDWGPELCQAFVEAGRLQGCHAQHRRLPRCAPAFRAGPEGAQAALERPGRGRRPEAGPTPGERPPLPGRAPPLSRPAGAALPRLRSFPCPPAPLLTRCGPPVTPGRSDPPAPPGPARRWRKLRPPQRRAHGFESGGSRFESFSPVRIPRLPPHPGALLVGLELLEKCDN